MIVYLFDSSLSFFLSKKWFWSQVQTTFTHHVENSRSDPQWTWVNYMGLKMAYSRCPNAQIVIGSTTNLCIKFWGSYQPKKPLVTCDIFHPSLRILSRIGDHLATQTLTTPRYKWRVNFAWCHTRSLYLSGLLSSSHIFTYLHILNSNRWSQSLLTPA